MLFNLHLSRSSTFFFYKYTATAESYTLSLHDALPIFSTTDERKRAPLMAAAGQLRSRPAVGPAARSTPARRSPSTRPPSRSEEHTSELQSQSNLVFRLLLEKKNQILHHSPVIHPIISS